MALLDTIDKWHIYYTIHLMAFTLSMDQAGRIIIPKPIRERHGFRDGTKFEVEESGESLRLTPVEVPARLEALENGWLVFHSDLPATFDISEDIARARDDRDQRAAGRPLTPLHE